MIAANEKFGVKVFAIVTDNAENMVQTRQILREKHGILEYGCAAHQMNSVEKDLVKSNLITKIVNVSAYSRFQCHWTSYNEMNAA